MATVSNTNAPDAADMNAGYDVIKQGESETAGKCNMENTQEEWGCNHRQQIGRIDRLLAMAAVKLEMFEYWEIFINRLLKDGGLSWLCEAPM